MYLFGSSVNTKLLPVFRYRTSITRYLHKNHISTNYSRNSLKVKQSCNLQKTENSVSGLFINNFQKHRNVCSIISIRNFSTNDSSNKDPPRFFIYFINNLLINFKFSLATNYFLLFKWKRCWSSTRRLSNNSTCDCCCPWSLA